MKSARAWLTIPLEDDEKARIVAAAQQDSRYGKRRLSGERLKLATWARSQLLDRADRILAKSGEAA